MQWFSGSDHQSFHFQAGTSCMLMLHGFMGTPAELRPLASYLSQAGVSSDAVVQPGFGPDLHHLATVGVPDWVDAAIAAWDRLAARYERVGVLGYSMGGAVALHVAAERPIDRLVLLAPLWRLQAGDRRVWLLPLLKHVVRAIRPFEKADFGDPNIRAALQEMTPSLDIDDPATQQILRGKIVLPSSTLDELRKLASRSDRMAKRVNVATTIIQGIQDQTVRAKDTRELLTRFSGSVAFHQLNGDHAIVSDQRPSWPEVRDLVVGFVAGGER